jgi:hypothetical protein
MSGAHVKRAPYAGCPGKYDFAYNRIDFRQNHFLGFGFVNYCRGWLLVFVRTALGFRQAGRGRLLHHDIPRRHMKHSAAWADQISHSSHSSGLRVPPWQILASLLPRLALVVCQADCSRLLHHNVPRRHMKPPVARDKDNCRRGWLLVFVKLAVADFSTTTSLTAI